MKSSIFREIDLKNIFNLKEVLLILILSSIITYGFQGVISNSAIDQIENNSEPDKISKSDFLMSYEEIIWTGVNTAYEPNKAVEFNSLYHEGNFYDIETNWTYFTNDYGIRNEPIRDNPEIRILILGNSNTLGQGVQYEKTYASLLEEKLITETGKDVEIINAGIDQSGMPDHYVFTKTFYDRMDPDIIMIADTEPSTNFARIERNRLGRKIDQNIQESGFNNEHTEGTANRVQEEYFRELDEDWSSSRVVTYGDEIIEYLDNNNTDLIVTCSQSCHDSVEFWTSERSIRLVEKPRAFHNLSEEVYRYPDDHLNDKGHKLVAENLINSLNWEKLISDK